MYDILVIGTVTKDVFLKSGDFQVVKDDRFRTGRAGCFVLGTKLTIPQVAMASGGGGTNVAVGLARQGFKVGCAGRVGDDSIAKEIIEEMKEEKVELLFTIDKKRNTAYSTILVSPDGERTILEYRGANEYMSENDIDWKDLKSKWVYIDSISGNIELLEYILDWAKKNSVRVVFNPDQKLIRMGKDIYKYIECADIFIANEDEYALITEIEHSEEKEEKIFKEIRNIAKDIIVMTKGPRGVVVADKKNIYSAGVPDSLVVDRTGAGDAFGSGFVSGYIQSGGDMESAIHLGIANATSVAKYFGTKNGLLKKNDRSDYNKVEIKIYKIV